MQRVQRNVNIDGNDASIQTSSCSLAGRDGVISAELRQDICRAPAGALQISWDGAGPHAQVEQSWCTMDEWEHLTTPMEEEEGTLFACQRTLST